MEYTICNLCERKSSCTTPEYYKESMLSCTAFRGWAALKKIRDLQLEIERWKLESGLEDSSGDPDGVTPESMGQYLKEIEDELDDLKSWKDGAEGAATIAYPPMEGPHTEEAYCLHKMYYERGPEQYRIGADVVSAAILAATSKTWRSKDD